MSIIRSVACLTTARCGRLWEAHEIWGRIINLRGDERSKLSSCGSLGSWRNFPCSIQNISAHLPALRNNIFLTNRRLYTPQCNITTEHVRTKTKSYRRHWKLQQSNPLIASRLLSQIYIFGFSRKSLKSLDVVAYRQGGVSCATTC